MEPITILYFTLGLMALSGGLGFYVGERGMAGVKIDLGNLKTDIERIKASVHPQTTQVVTPVGSTKATDTITVTATPNK